MSGIELIAAERERQVSQEGWTAEHDDAHDRCELVEAAICYADSSMTVDTSVPLRWPFDEEWWKPSPDPIRNLVKAAALIAAEIDRLKRLEK